MSGFKKDRKVSLGKALNPFTTPEQIKSVQQCETAPIVIVGFL